MTEQDIHLVGEQIKERFEHREAFYESLKPLVQSLIEEGAPLTGIMQALNEKDIKTYEKRKWTVDSLRKLLRALDLQTKHPRPEMKGT